MEQPKPSYGMFLGSMLMFGSVYLFYFAYGLIAQSLNIVDLPVNSLSNQQYADISNSAAALNFAPLLGLVVIVAIILGIMMSLFAYRSVEASVS